MSAAATPAHPAAGPPRSGPWRRWVLEPAMVIGLGVAIGGLMSLRDRGTDLVVSLAAGGGVGLMIEVNLRLGFALLGKAVDRLGKQWAFAARAALYAAGGLAAWLTVKAVAALVFHQQFGRDTSLYLPVTGALTVVFGFGFYGYSVLRSRLEASVARLKEVEFAAKELQLARELQSRLLPPPEIDGNGYRIAARNLAANLVAGDFYDSFLLPDGALGVVVGDVAGKGMAAALIMASVKAMLPLVAAERSAADTLREVNRRLAAELPGREFVALAFARFEPAAGRVELANAGLPDPYLLAAGGAVAPQVVPGARLPLGVRREVDYRSLVLRLAPGDRLLLLTDGLAEARTAGGEPLGYDALASLMAAPGGEASPPLAWLDGLVGRVRAATRPVLEDDWTVLVLERERAAAQPALAAGNL